MLYCAWVDGLFEFLVWIFSEKIIFFLIKWMKWSQDLLWFVFIAFELPWFFLLRFALLLICSDFFWFFDFWFFFDLICFNLFWLVLISFEFFWSVLICFDLFYFDLFWFVLICFDSFWFILIGFDSFLFICISMDYELSGLELAWVPGTCGIFGL